MPRAKTKRRRYPSQDDPRLKTAAYLAIRNAWQNHVTLTNKQGGAVYCEATKCLLPGVPIRMGGTRTGAHLDVGHLIPRVLDERTSWTLADTRPEHARCNRHEGVEVGRARGAARRAAQAEQRAAQPLTISNDDW